MIRKDRTISARKMSQSLPDSQKASERTVQRDLDDMKEKKILSRIGGRFYGEWIINE